MQLRTLLLAADFSEISKTSSHIIHRVLLVFDKIHKFPEKREHMKFFNIARFSRIGRIDCVHIKIVIW